MRIFWFFLDTRFSGRPESASFTEKRNCWIVPFRIRAAGNMIADVTFGKTRYRPAPARFEAGTGNIAGAVGLGAALDYVEKTGIQ